ncbi:MAG: MraY family glycosyltransferase [Bacillota bacterium]
MPLGVLVISWFVTRAILPRFMMLLEISGTTRPNYRGQNIPVAGGLVLVAGAFAGLMVMAVFTPHPPGLFPFLFGLLAMALVGTLDDLWGSRDTLGFRGHLTSLWRGEMTTGAVKAMAGAGVALLISLELSRSWWEIPVRVLMIALLTNTMNLLDMRPGRSIKGFLAGTAGLLILTKGGFPSVYLLAVTGPVLAFAPYDLGARAMLGDAGSNLMGIALGIGATWILPLDIQAMLILILAIFHWYAETYSLTKLIERNNWLRYLDKLGRT